ncbi:MAG: hypothetical protein EBU90_26275 [Proteobacteria bacterium]|nr:hypothetical protein [Pseudomonadota bacterium]
MAAVLSWQTGGRVVAVSLDACVTFGAEITAEPTEHAVERGASISDHVRPGHDTFTLEGTITQTPIVDDGSAPSRAGLRTVALRPGASTSTWGWESPWERVRAVDALLRDAVASGALATLATGLRPEVSDLVITRYRAERSTAIGDAIGVTLELRRIRLVSIRRVEVPVPAQRRGQRQAQRGAQTAGQSSDRRSALARALDGARSLL